jgi:hypothetical protein
LEPGKEIKLVLEHENGSRFVWFENGKQLQDQYKAFATYNPELLKIMRVIVGTGIRSVTRADLMAILHQNKDALGRYFRDIRPDLVGERVRIRKSPPQYGYRIPAWCVCELLADFIPIIEEWLPNTILMKRMNVSESTITQHHRNGSIESVSFLGRIWISPVGEVQLRSVLRNGGEPFEVEYRMYYPATAMAKETIALRGLDVNNPKILRIFMKKYTRWIMEVPHSSCVRENGNIKGVNIRTKDMFCDAVSIAEAAHITGLARVEIKALLDKKVLVSYEQTYKRRVSYRSLMAYKQANLTTKAATAA